MLFAVIWYMVNSVTVMRTKTALIGDTVGL